MDTEQVAPKTSRRVENPETKSPRPAAWSLVRHMQQPACLIFGQPRRFVCNGAWTAALGVPRAGEEVAWTPDAVPAAWIELAADAEAGHNLMASAPATTGVDSRQWSPWRQPSMASDGACEGVWITLQDTTAQRLADARQQVCHGLLSLDATTDFDVQVGALLQGLAADVAFAVAYTCPPPAATPTLQLLWPGIKLADSPCFKTTHGETLKQVCARVMRRARAETVQVTAFPWTPFGEVASQPVPLLVLPLTSAVSSDALGALAWGLTVHSSQNDAVPKLLAEMTPLLVAAWHRHHQAAHALRAQRFLNDGLEIARMGTWHVDLQNHQTLASPSTALLFGEPVTKQDVFGIVNRLVHADDRAGLRQAYYAAIEARQPYDHEFRIIRRDGEVRWLFSRGLPSYDAAGNPASVCGVIGDITQRVHDRQKLEHLAATLQDAIGARDAFLAMASHELRTPLTALRLQVEHFQHRLHRRGADACTLEATLAFAARIAKQAHKLTRLIDDMLDISRITAGKLSLTREPCDLAGIVRETAAHYLTHFADTGCSLNLVLQEGIVGLWDCGRLEQVLANLLTNALRYAPGKDVCIQVGADAGGAFLWVADDGEGVPPELQAGLFKRFHSGDTHGAMGGLGLGLHICHHIITEHGGTIDYVPQSHCGARFEMKLPYCPKTHDEARATQ